MIKRLAALLVLSLPALANNFTYVQSTGTKASTVSALTTAFATANTAGNLIVIVTYGQTSAPTDTQGNTYTPVPAGVGTAIAVYWAKNIHGGANTVNSTAAMVTAIEYNSVNPTYCMLEGAELTGGTNSFTGGVVYRTASDAVAILAAETCCGGFGAPSLASGTIRKDFTSAVVDQVFVGDDFVSAVSSTYTNSWTGFPGSASLVAFLSQTGCGGGTGAAPHSFSILW